MADIKIIVDSSDVVTADNRIDQLGKSGAVAEKGIGKAARGMNQFGKVSAMGGKKMNTFNMQIQQGGYQLQDFVVQLQSGTSFFTAFGQQGSQFAGVFGPQGAVIGAVIAIGSAVGGMAYKMATGSKDVEALEDSLKSLETAVDDYAKASKDALDATKAANEEFGFTSDTLEGIIATMSLIAETKAFDQLGATINKLREEHLQGFQSDLENVADLLGLDGWFAELSSESTGFNALLKTMENDSRSIGERIQAGLSLKGIILEYGGSYGEMTDLQKAFFDDLIVSIENMEYLRGLQQGDRESAAKDKADKKAAADAEEERLKKLANLSAGRWSAFKAQHKTSFSWIADKKKAEEESEKDKAKRIANNWRAFTRQHKASLTFTATYKKEQEKLQAQIALGYKKSGGLAQALTNETNTYIESLVAGFEAAADLKDELGEAAFEAGRFAGIDMTKPVSDSAKEALLLAGRLGIAFETAIALKKLEAEGDSGNGAGYEAVSNELSLRLRTGMGFVPDPEPEKKGKTAKIDPLVQFQTQLDLEDKLLNVSEARQKVLQALGSDVVAKNPEIVAGMEAQITETNKLIALEEKRQGLIDSVTGSIENGMMAMIDGTMSVKDAFKSMAAEIIKELYRVLVVQQLVAAAKVALGFADGGAVTSSPRPPVRPQADGGVFTKVNAYASGGIVSSPTNFPMAGNQVGLMGEAGPEAIMPLKRGSNGKLGVQMEGGGGGDVININQSFNFQANGDDTVKKLIAQAAPKIADMAKASVIDSRRRGGSTKAAFG